MTVHDLRKLSDNLALMKFCNAIAPKITLEKSFHLPVLYSDDIDGNEESSPYDAKVSIELNTYSYTQLKQLEIFPEKFLGLLINATNMLKQAMELWEFLGKADEFNDRSHWDLVSISDHPQNKHYSSWVILILLCRDLWEATYL